MKPSKLEIESVRLARFSELLRARACLLRASNSLDFLRRSRTSRHILVFCEELICENIDVVWKAQQACVEYELKYPLER